MDETLLEILYTYSLILSRVLGFFLLVPFFGSMQIPTRVKTGLALFVAFMLYPVLTQEGMLPPPGDIVTFSLILIYEMITGFILGLSLQVTFASIQLAGEFIDRRMGLFLANVFDPQTGEQAPLAGQLKMIFATLLFLSFEGHHLMLRGLLNSFHSLALGDPFPVAGSAGVLVRIMGDHFIIGFQIALPVIAALFIVDMVFGFLARTIPQINIFVVGLPTKILAGLFILFLAMPTFVDFFYEFIWDMFYKFDALLRALGG